MNDFIYAHQLTDPPKIMALNPVTQEYEGFINDKQFLMKIVTDAVGKIHDLQRQIDELKSQK